jgi:xanthine dehydrogenase YagS FAD-binding subunit
MTEFHVTPEEAARVGHAIGSAAAEHRLRRGEIITGYRFATGSVARSAYVKIRERASYEYAMVSAAATVEVDDGVVAAARIALGSVAYKPWRLRQAEQAIRGVPLESAALARVLDEALAGARPPAGNEFKVRLARNAALRALLDAAARS